MIETGTVPDDLASKIMLMRDPETGDGFDVDEMVDQVAIFFLAGHETSASTLAWALYLLAMHPEWQDQLASEAQALEVSRAMLEQLGIASLADKVSFQLSGGQKRIVTLASVLVMQPDVLLLDEPTNDLDVETLRALEDALVDFAGCAVVISHDRFFLDRICTHMLAFEGDAHVEWFEGNFEDYEEDKKRRLGADALEPKRIKHKKFAR